MPLLAWLTLILVPSAVSLAAHPPTSLILEHSLAHRRMPKGETLRQRSSLSLSSGLSPAPPLSPQALPRLRRRGVRKKTYTPFFLRAGELKVAKLWELFGANTAICVCSGIEKAVRKRDGFWEGDTIMENIESTFDNAGTRDECTTWARSDLTDPRWRSQTEPSLNDEVAYSDTEKLVASFHSEYGFEAEKCGCISRLAELPNQAPFQHEHCHQRARRITLAKLGLGDSVNNIVPFARKHDGRQAHDPQLDPDTETGNSGGSSSRGEKDGNGPLLFRTRAPSSSPRQRGAPMLSLHHTARAITHAGAAATRHLRNADASAMAVAAAGEVKATLTALRSGAAHRAATHVKQRMLNGGDGSSSSRHGVSGAAVPFWSLGTRVGKRRGVSVGARHIPTLRGGR